MDVTAENPMPEILVQGSATAVFRLLVSDFQLPIFHYSSIPPVLPSFLLFSSSSHSISYQL